LIAYTLGCVPMLTAGAFMKTLFVLFSASGSRRYK